MNTHQASSLDIFPFHALPALESIIFSPPTVTSSTSLKQVIELVTQARTADSPRGGQSPNNDSLNQGNPRCVVILEDNQPTGIVTERDLEPWVVDQNNAENVAIAAVMQPVITLALSQFCQQFCILQVCQQQAHEVLVVDHGGQLLGVLNRDKVKRFLQSAHLFRFRQIREVTTQPKLQTPTPESLRTKPRTQPLAFDPHHELDSVLNSVQDVIWSVSLPSCEVRYVNAAVERLYHHPQAEFFYRSPLWWDLIHPIDRDRILNLWMEVRHHQRQEWDVEYRIIDAEDGQTRWVSDRARVILDTHQQPLHIDGITTDITDRKTLDFHLRSALQDLSCYKLALDEFALVARIDLNGIITQVNEQFCQASHYAPEELLGAPITMLEADDHPDIFREIWDTVQQGNVWQGEIKNRAKDGKVFWVNQVMVPFPDSKGAPQCYLVIQTDITEKKQAEENLQRTNEQFSLSNAELERATRLKDEFLANMSHELRTPLNSILGLSEMLQDSDFGDLNEKQHRFVEVISQSGIHLLSLINDILDLAKIESGKVELHIAPASIQTLCQSSLSFVQQAAYAKHITLASDISDVVEEIQIDELRIRQALINLLSNAVKFTPSGGRVLLTVDYEFSTNSPSQQTPPMIRFSIRDTGIGIASEDIPRLFQSFIQLDSNLNRQYNGTGLGLALVKRIAEMHQGSVSVESKLGQGSCFTINLPCVVSTLPTQAESEPKLQCKYKELLGSPGSTNQPLILLAEDNQANIDTFSAYLTNHGYRILIATDGQEALDLMQTHHPDLVLMDIQMPGMDGLAATQQIRTRPELAHTPIIALTALAMAGDRERCFAVGVDEYLTKPVRLKNLLGVIQQYCLHKR